MQRVRVEVGRACMGAGSVREVGVYREEDVIRSETAQAVGALRTLARPAGGVAV